MLDLGIIKSSKTYGGTGSRLESEKHHYFVHLSLQEYFTACHLVNALQHQPSVAIEFIREQKYNLWFLVVLIFISGLLSAGGDKRSRDTFWSALLSEPLDLIGVRHMHMIILCLNETENIQTLTHYNQLMDTIAKWVQTMLE